jgi:hypothetical protein
MATAFIVTLQTHDVRAHRRLAQMLKTALRRDQLRCTDLREVRDDEIEPSEPDCAAPPDLKEVGQHGKYSDNKDDATF